MHTKHGLQNGEDLDANSQAVWPIQCIANNPMYILQEDILYTTIDKSDPDASEKMFRAMTAPAPNGKAWLNKTFYIADIAVYPYHYAPGDDGEVVAAVFTSIVTDSGEIINIRSNGILQSIAAAAKCGLLPPERKDVLFTLVQVQSTPDTAMFQLQIADTGDSQSKPKGK